MKYTFEDNKKVFFACPTCFNTVNLTIKTEIIGDNSNELAPKFIDPHFDSSNCVCGRCGARMFLVDAEIGEQINTLNKMGYRTAYSCSGHNEIVPMNHKIVSFNPAEDGNDMKKKTSLSIKDVSGKPKYRHNINNPYVKFKHDIPAEKKKLLFDACNKLQYENFTVKCYNANKYGTRTTEECDPTKENSVIIIEKIKSSDNDKTTKDFNSVVKDFIHMLDDLIVELSKSEQNKTTEPKSE